LQNYTLKKDEHGKKHNRSPLMKADPAAWVHLHLIWNATVDMNADIKHHSISDTYFYSTRFEDKPMLKSVMKHPWVWAILVQEESS